MNSVNVILLCSLIGGIITLLVKVCFASKCEDISVCYGLIKVKRNVHLEKKTISKLESQDLEENIPKERKTLQIEDSKE